MKQISLKLDNKKLKNFTWLLILLIILVVAAYSCVSLYATNDTSEISSNEDLVSPACTGILSLFMAFFRGGLEEVVNTFTNTFSPIPEDDWFFTLSGAGSVANAFFDFFYFLGYFLTFTVFAFSLMMVGMSGFLDNKNKFFELLARLVLGCVLIATSRRILDAINYSFQLVWDQIVPVEYVGGSVTSTSDKVATAFSVAINPASLLLDLILIIAFFIEFLKFLLEIMERFIVTRILYISAPAVNGLVVSRTTSGIMLNFYRMYFSQLLLLLFNRVFSFMLSNMVKNVFEHETFEMLSWLFLIAMCKAAQRIDSYMKSMGLTVAQTGSAVLDSVMGAIHMLGKGWGSVKNGAGFIGATQMKIGAATGNYGLYKAGMAKQAFSKGGITGAISPKSEGQVLKQFAEAGGNTNATIKDNKKRKDALAIAMTNSFNRGNYLNLGSFDNATQTKAAKNVLGSSFRDATGFNANNISSAHFNSKGDIEGKVQVGGFKKGEKPLYSTFKVSADSLKGRAGTIATSDGQLRNIQMSGSFDNLSDFGDYEYTKGGLSNLASASGCNLDDDRLQSLGASYYMVDRDYNELYVSDDKGDVIYARGLESGNELWGSADKSGLDLEKKDFAVGGKYHSVVDGESVQFIVSCDDNTIVANTSDSKYTFAGVNGNIFQKDKYGNPLRDSDGHMNSFEFNGNHVDLNNKNLKIIDNKNRGSYAVIKNGGKRNKGK